MNVPAARALHKLHWHGLTTGLLTNNGFGFLVTFMADWIGFEPTYFWASTRRLYPLSYQSMLLADDSIRNVPVEPTFRVALPDRR